MPGRDSSAASVNALTVVALVAAVVVGAVLAPVVYDAASSTQKQDSVAVLTLSGYISSDKVDSLTTDLREVRQNDSVKAVVLKIDSGGGAVAPSEKLYLEVLRTSEEMPVVASIQGVAASGAYYALLPADQVYAMSSSTVGSVGVYGPSGGAPVPDSILRSGPDKASPTADKQRRVIESLKRQFVGRVVEHRGQNISLSREEIAYAKTYLGHTSVKNGYADEIGSLSVAVDDAADRAGLENYDVYRKEPPRTAGLFFFQSTVDNRTVLYRQSADTVGPQPVRQYLYVNEIPYHDVEVSANVSA
jgi:protease-4